MASSELTNSVPGRKAESNNIDEEHVLIEQLLFAAKNGVWDQVWDILKAPGSSGRAYLINVIPENRRWGVIHQAIYWKKPDVLQHLLMYTECDSSMRVKQCTSECGDTSRMNAVEIAQAYGYKIMEEVLTQHRNIVLQQEVRTLVPYANCTESKALPLVSITLAAYKKTFHPRPIDSKKSIYNVLGDIFSDINTSPERWKEVMEKVADSVYIVSVENYNKVLKSKTKEEFYMNIIDTYTEEQNLMYLYLNMAFRRQAEKGYKPTGDDLALGPYAVMYQMLLLFWQAIQKETGTTYRAMLLKQTDIDQYQIGTRFVWQSIVSSSTEPENAKPFPSGAVTPESKHLVMFTIDNSANSAWQPRNIEKYAKYMKHERTYPAGGKFYVSDRSVINEQVHVSLKLLAK